MAPKCGRTTTPSICPRSAGRFRRSTLATRLLLLEPLAVTIRSTTSRGLLFVKLQRSYSIDHDPRHPPRARLMLGGLRFVLRTRRPAGTASDWLFLIELELPGCIPAVDDLVVVRIGDGCVD